MMGCAALLLLDESACLRYRVLDTILGVDPADSELRELESLRREDPLFVAISSSFFGADAGSFTRAPLKKDAYSLSFALMRLGFLGFGRDEPIVRRLAETLLSLQRKDGTWAMDKNGPELDEQLQSTAMRSRKLPLSVAIPLRGLGSCGYAEDDAAERAYDALMSYQLDDGAWPVYTKDGVNGYIAGYRSLPQSRWGCRNSTTFALACLSFHPGRRREKTVRKGLDLLLGRETRDDYALGLEASRMAGLEPIQGFFSYFARFDMAVILDLCARMGATMEDGRVDDLVDHIVHARNENGLWQNSRYPRATRWLTFSLLDSLSRIDASGDWLSTRARTPFRAYRADAKRF